MSSKAMHEWCEDQRSAERMADAMYRLMPPRMADSVARMSNSLRRRDAILSHASLAVCHVSRRLFSRVHAFTFRRRA